MARGVHSAHQKRIFHRDLKPGNILVQKNETGWSVKVIDFGLAVRMKVAVQASNIMAGANASERDKSFTGTFDFAAPEQKGKLPGVKVGPYSDVYAFGKTCLMALFGTTEAKSWHWNKLPAEKRPAVQELLERCTAEELDIRWPSFAEVIPLLETLTVDPGADAATKAANLKRWESSNNPRKWVESRLQGWNDDQWRKLLAVVKGSAYWPLDETELGRSLEATRRQVLAERQAAEERKQADEAKQRAAADKAAADKKAADDRAAEELRRQEEARKRPPAKLEAPFSTKQAQESQQAWAKFLGQNVIEELDLGKGVKLPLALIPPGTFMMGGKADDEKPARKVTISKPLYLGVSPVTQAQWETVMGTTPSSFSRTGERKHVVEGVSEADLKLFPVENVSWKDAEAFCWRVTGRCETLLRLPTEAEWEYACRAGTTTEFYFGNVLNGTQANCNSTKPDGTTTRPYLQRTTKVGDYAARSPHPFGLSDMHGNVWEWCADWYGPYSALTTTVDPEQTEQQSNECRVLRGGSWINNAENCRAAYRNRNRPANCNRIYGFRVCFRLHGCRSPGPMPGMIEFTDSISVVFGRPDPDPEPFPRTDEKWRAGAVW